MSSAWLRAAGAALFVLGPLPSACNGGGQATPHSAPSPVDAGISAIAALRFVVDPGLACADDAGGAGGICVRSSQTLTFGIEGLAGTNVSLELEGSYGDAALSMQQVTLGAGPTLVTLETSSASAMFSVVARVGSAEAPQTVGLRVTVTTSGQDATINASPLYSGHRPAETFYATGFVLSTCAELTANVPDASAVAWTSGPNGVAIALGATAGERVAVQMRIGHYAFGCADVDPLAPGATIAVPVQIYDVPMALSLTDLSATFSFTPDGAATSGWTSVTQAAAARIQGSFFASSTSDGAALLNAMSAAITTAAGQTQFSNLRQQGGWDTTAVSWMSSHPPSINARAATWLTTATSVAMGPLVSVLGNGTSAGTAPLSVTSFGSLTAAAAGVVPPSAFEWTADANDTVHLSGEIDLASTPLLAHQADADAASIATGATDVPSAIALGIDCAGLASSLVGTGVSYGSCAAACTATLCGTALASVWKSVGAAAAGGSDIVATTITASAPAQVGDLAEPAYVEGGWLGNVSGAGVPIPFAITGAVLATEIPASAAPVP